MRGPAPLQRSATGLKFPGFSNGKKMKRIVSFLLKIAVSGFLLYISLNFVDFGALMQRLSRIDWAWLAASLAVLALQVGLVAQRWRLIARPCGAEIHLRQALSYTLIGLFFNQALPSTVGGDAARIWLLAREPSGWKAAIHSVLIDRAAGLIWLTFIVLVCLPWSLEYIKSPIGQTMLVLIGVGGVAGPISALILIQAGRPWLAGWRVTRHLVEVAATTWTVLSSWRIGCAVAGLSIMVHLLTVMAAWCVAQAVGSPAKLMDILLLIPPVVLVSAIPVSIAGWGVREGAMVAAFSYAGLPEVDGLTVSLLLGACIFLIGLLGGLAWIFGSNRLTLGPWPMRQDSPSP